MAEQSEQKSLNTKLLLRVHAANLPRQGLLKSAPSSYAVITSFTRGARTSGPSNDYDHDNDQPSVGNGQCLRTLEWGRTEVIYKNAHPQYTETFTLNYEYGSECYFYVQVYRYDNNNKDDDDDDDDDDDKKKRKEKPFSFGNAVYEIGDILGSRNNTKAKRLPQGGVVFCRLEPIRTETQNLVFQFQFTADDLDVSGGMKRRPSLQSMLRSAPDTILQISKKHQHDAWIAVYRSSPVEESYDPTWDTGELNLECLCNGDLDRPIRLSVLLRQRNKDTSVAQCETTPRAILNTQRDYNEDDIEREQTKHGFRLQKKSTIQKSKQKQVGWLRVVLAQIIDKEKEIVVEQDTDERFYDNCDDASILVDLASLPSPMAAPTTASFQDFVEAGYRLDFGVAIDFTSSNGDYRIPGTLHDQNAYNMNDYEETIVAIGNAVSVYSDQDNSVWGFGAKFNGEVRHVFQCGPNAQVQGVDGILEAYKSIFRSDLTMSGPTLFDQVIQTAAARAHKHKQEGRKRYCVLLIITDGISQNMEETKRKLQVYMSVPLSVVFVGVGRSDFKTMHELSLYSNTTVVEFRQHQHDPNSLGKAALKEIPNQLVRYMTENGIQPN